MGPFSLNRNRSKTAATFQGRGAVVDGSQAVVLTERDASDAAVASPGEPAARLGELWAAEADCGHLNQNGRPLLQVGAENDGAAAGAIFGLALTGLRTTGFLSSTALVEAYNALTAAAGRRLTTVLHVAAQAAAKPALTTLPGHDGYHSVADAGWFQLFARDAQETADLGLIAHYLAEQGLTPGLVAQDAFLTTHRAESVRLPEPELIAAYLGHPDDLIDAPTPAQRLVFGAKRRRIPELWSVDHPAMSGGSRAAEAYAEGVAGQRPFYLEPIASLADVAMESFAHLTGRHYDRIGTFQTEDADYLIVGQGSVIPSAEAVAEHLRKSRRLRVGVVNLTLFRPFPGDLLGALLRGRKGVVVLERLDQPLAEDTPLLREVRAVVHKCLENGQARRGENPYPAYASYSRPEHAPSLFSAIYGLGGRTLAAEDLIGAVENMLPNGARRRRAYLSLSFLAETSATPKQEIFQQALADAYPELAGLTLRGSENPLLLPKRALAIRVHERAGRAVFQPEDHPARTLFELKGLFVKTYPEPGPRPKGHPSVVTLAAGAEPLRGNWAPRVVDVVLVSEPSLLTQGDLLAGLKDGGALILQSAAEGPEAVWTALPQPVRQAVTARRLQVFAIDALKLAREDARDPGLQWRLAGKVLQGALLAAPPCVALTGLAGKELIRELKRVLLARMEEAPPEAVEAELSPFRSGMESLMAVPHGAEGEPKALPPVEALPEVLKHRPIDDVPAWDLHRFWEQTASLYGRPSHPQAATAAGQGPDGVGTALAEPFTAAGFIPAGTGLLRDLSTTRTTYPRFLAEKCTGCGECWTVCPDSALPGQVSRIGALLETALRLVEERGHSAQHLPRAVRLLEGRLRDLLAKGAQEGLPEHLATAVSQTVAASKLTTEDKKALEAEFAPLLELLRPFPLAVTPPFFGEAEKKAKGSGGLLSITLDPTRCQGCMACATACPEEALVPEAQTTEALSALRANWAFWQRLPGTDGSFIRLDAAPGDEGPGLRTLLLDKRAYQARVGGDLGEAGAAPRTLLHLFAATATAALQPRVAGHLTRLDDLVARLEQHIRLHLAVDVEDTDALLRATSALRNREYTLSELSGQLDRERNPIDAAWLERVTGLLSGLKRLRWLYREGPGHQGRAALGMVEGLEADDAWHATYPFNPYPFPWSGHALAEGPAAALGVFEGHMARMAEGFRLIRMTELELDGKYLPAEHDAYFHRFSWRDFSEEEFLLCPPLLVAGSDRALAGAGLQALSALLRSGRPIKTLVLDRQAYRLPAGSGAGGSPAQSQALALFGMAHQDAYVLQGGLGDVPRLLEGFLAGLSARRPALFNVYCASLPAHGQADDRAVLQSRLALESRAHPLLRYDPERGAGPHERLVLEGNPAPGEDWPTHTLSYRDENGAEQSLTAALTYADYAATVPALQSHFQVIPAAAWSDAQLPLAEYLALDAADREESRPFIWAVDHRGRLARLSVAPAIVRACEERQACWRLLRTLGRQDIVPVDTDAIAEKAQAEVVDRVWRNLVEMAQGNGELTAALVGMAGPAAPQGQASNG